MADDILTPPILNTMVEPFYYSRSRNKLKRHYVPKEEENQNNVDYTTFHIIAGIICFALNYKQNLENNKLTDFDRILRALVAALLGPLYLVVFAALWTMQ